MRGFFSIVLLFGSIFLLQAEWQELEIQMEESVWCSSSLTESLNGKRVTYGPDALFDGDYHTPWVEGVPGSGVGESILIQTNRGIEEFSIVNGFPLSERLFLRNNRIRKTSFYFVAGLTAPGLVTELDYYLYFTQEMLFSENLLLEDNGELQSFMMEESVDSQWTFFRDTVQHFSEEFPDFFHMILDDLDMTMFDFDDEMNIRLILEVYGYTGLKMVITDVYKGSHYDDTCVSEIDLTLTDF